MVLNKMILVLVPTVRTAEAIVITPGVNGILLIVGHQALFIIATMAIHARGPIIKAVRGRTL